MTRARTLAVLSVFMLSVVLAGCTQESQEQPAEEEVLAAYAADDLEGVVAPGDVELDPAVSSDGGGSLKIAVSEAASVALYDAGDLDVENATLTYRARLRCQDLEGRAYLEMWCTFGDMGDYFSRGLDSAISATVDWTTLATPFFLQAGENPTNVRLNVVVEGTGTVWVDELQVVKTPLP